MYWNKPQASVLDELSEFIFITHIFPRAWHAVKLECNCSGETQEHRKVFINLSFWWGSHKTNVIFNKSFLNPRFYFKQILFRQHLIFSSIYSGCTFLKVCRWQHENRNFFRVYVQCISYMIWCYKNVRMCIWKTQNQNV